MGAVWLQDGKPAKVRYAWNSVWILKYHYYICGSRFVYKIHFLPDAPPSLQRILLKIQPYDFEIKYIPGKEVALADAISRVNHQDEMEQKSFDFTTWMN